MRTLAAALAVTALGCGRIAFDPLGEDGGALAPWPTLDGEWTWMSGSTVGDTGPVYGTQNVAAATNAPSSRDNGAFWRSGSTLWMFGGIGMNATQQGLLADTWSYDIPTGEWTWRGGSTAVNDAGSYGTRGVPAATNLPSARNDVAMWKASDTELWMFGGNLGSGVPVLADDVWRLDATTGVWTWMSGTQSTNAIATYGTRGVEAPTNDPGARSAVLTWPTNDGFYLYGGGGFPRNASIEYMSDLWKYTASTGAWTWIAGPSIGGNASNRGTLGVASPTTLPTYYGACAFGDARDGALWMLDTQGDVYRFDLATTNWTWIAGPAVDDTRATPGPPRVLSDSATPGVSVSVNCWSDARNNLWLQGGFNGVGTDTGTNALWLFETDVQRWALVTGDTGTQQPGSYGTRGVADPANTPSARQNGMDWIGPDGELWLFGGDFATDANGTEGVRMADLWRFAKP
ncbi:MAG TPA: kelch repeat-containing protein [Kofleriaceae bacterium]|jgi:hypothetical protein